MTLASPITQWHDEMVKEIALAFLLAEGERPIRHEIDPRGLITCHHGATLGSNLVHIPGGDIEPAEGQRTPNEVIFAVLRG